MAVSQMAKNFAVDLITDETNRTISERYVASDVMGAAKWLNFVVIAGIASRGKHRPTPNVRIIADEERLIISQGQAIVE